MQISHFPSAMRSRSVFFYDGMSYLRQFSCAREGQQVERVLGTRERCDVLWGERCGGRFELETWIGGVVVWNRVAPQTWIFGVERDVSPSTRNLLPCWR